MLAFVLLALSPLLVIGNPLPQATGSPAGSTGVAAGTTAVATVTLPLVVLVEQNYGRGLAGHGGLTAVSNSGSSGASPTIFTAAVSSAGATGTASFQFGSTIYAASVGVAAPSVSGDIAETCTWPLTPTTTTVSYLGFSQTLSGYIATCTSSAYGALATVSASGSQTHTEMVVPIAVGTDGHLTYADSATLASAAPTAAASSSS